MMNEMNISEALKVFKTNIEIRLDGNTVWEPDKIRDLIERAYIETLEIIIKGLDKKEGEG